MPRSSKKIFFICKKIFKTLMSISKGESNTNVIKTYSRNSVITPECIGLTFLVHNGNNFIKVRPSETMVGSKLGEFSPTRRRPKHKTS